MNGCYNRAPFVNGYWAADGYIAASTGELATRMPLMAWVPFKMAKDCRYQADDKYQDKQCQGCIHKKGNT